MTSHAFARQLLAGPDLEIMTPKVRAYSNDEDNYCSAELVVTEEPGENRISGSPVRILVIGYNDRPQSFPRRSRRGRRPPAQQGDHHDKHRQYGESDQ